MINVFLNSEILSTALLSAVIAAVLIPLVAIVAKQVGLVDKPDHRKLHDGEIPIVGGMCIYFAALIAMSFVHMSVNALLPLILGAGLIIVGAIDDRVGLSTLIRIPVQAATAVAMIVVGNLTIETIGNITGLGAFQMTAVLSVAFTIVCTIGVINSINMIDGVDGLSGSIIGITLLTLAGFSYQAGDINSVVLLLSLLGANLAFLLYNSRFIRSRAAVFMGDAGSMLFGFLLVWYFIKLTQGENAVLSPVAAGWIFGLPLMDTVAVMVGRVLNKRSPLEADRNHFHHRLLNTGLTPNQVVVTMSILHLLLVIGGIVCNSAPALEPLFFWSFIVLVVLHYFVTPKILQHFQAYF